MTHLLLTGAGFTHNWKGWLAKEMEGDRLLRLHGNPAVHARVRDADGFGSALAGLQLDVKEAKPTRFLNLECAELFDVAHGARELASRGDKWGILEHSVRFLGLRKVVGIEQDDNAYCVS